jgi:hypothetical protein
MHVLLPYRILHQKQKQQDVSFSILQLAASNFLLCMVLLQSLMNDKKLHGSAGVDKEEITTITTNQVF